MNIKACIFDLDGVIVDTAGYHYKAWKNIADHLGFEFTLEQNEPLKGLSRMDSLTELLKIGDFVFSETDKQKYCHTKNQDYLKLINSINGNEILPGVSDFIDQLLSQGILIALGSASKNARYILEKVGLKDKFQIIVDGNDVINSKPDPEVFIKAAQGLQVNPHESIVFEDSYKGLVAANAGGFRTVGIGEASILTNAEVVFSNFTKFSPKSIFKQLAKAGGQL